MKILALEPYYGGSHRAFLDGWSSRSRHNWTVLGLPDRKWKWRMRHAAIECAEAVGDRLKAGESFDFVFCSDMLNLAEFRGLVDGRVQALPSVVYFHENQLTYPDQHAKDRDQHFAFTNLTSCLAADQVWFNSEYHRRTFLTAMAQLTRRMPDFRPTTAVENIAPKSQVHPPGIDPPPSRPKRRPGPLRILWAARWEHDKGPEDFFEAAKALKETGVSFRLNVVGQRFDEAPNVFAWAQEHFRDQIDHWGWQTTREDYCAALLDSDVVVSTARHEFFGISVLEAITAGVYPLLPQRLAYPEILSLERDGERQRFFYDGTTVDLAAKLAELATAVEDQESWQRFLDPVMRDVERFYWDNLVGDMDDALERVKRSH